MSKGHSSPESIKAWREKNREWVRKYSIWSGMIARCHNESHNKFHYYGGRGIKVCQRWRDSIDLFFADMGEMPSPKHTVDRIDNNGDYCPENCRWATRTDQARNRRSNRLITVNGVTKSLAEWSEETGIGRTTISLRIDAGVPPDIAVSLPPMRCRRKGLYRR